jgi:hypothetical protein
LERYRWSALNAQQVGKYFEYFVKMELTMYGLEVYTTEVDDRGVDFIARGRSGRFVEVQVKALRNYGYVFLRKRHFELRPGLYVALGLLFDGSEPEAYLIPSSVWSRPNAVFKDRNYCEPGQVSEPEWGINISRKGKAILSEFSMTAMLPGL